MSSNSKGEEEAPSLAECLASALPKDAEFTFYHLSTPPTRSAALFSAPPGAKPERTYTESHFLSVAITTSSAGPEERGEVLCLAIEVLIYTTRHLTTIFVSKADSTGYLSLLDLGKGHESPLRTITTTFLEFIVQTRRRKGKKVVLSLFARANDQYLFPGSVENPGKHVSDDRQLVKWWCRVLDPVLQHYPAAQDGNGEVTSQAYLIIPGEDSITPYLPQRVRLDPSLKARWKHGHPLLSLTRHPTAPPRCLIPHFPDDPKARFLDELDDELPDNNTSSQNVEASPSKKGSGHWKSVRSLEQFWEMMAFRQECSSGRLVGFLWVVFASTTPEEEAIGESQESVESQQSIAEVPRLSPSGASPSRRRAKGTRSLTHKKKPRKPLRGPIIPRTPKIKRAQPTSSTTSRTSNLPPVSSPYFLWPEHSRGTLVFADKDYKKATERLLQLQFKSLETATASTRAWLEEVGVLAGRRDGGWGWSVRGRKEAQIKDSGETNGTAAAPMMMVKKKRKAEAAVDEVVPGVESNGVNMLGAGLVKKKKKVMQVQV